MMAAAQLDPAWADEYVAFITDRRRVLHTILSRGVTRGELRTDADLEVAVDMLFGPWWYRLLARHAPLDDDFAATLVTQLLAGIGADLAAQNFTEQ